MRGDWARDHKLKIRRTPRDRKRLFELGNGKSVRPIGRVRADVIITRAASSSSPPRKKKEWFYVFEKCPVPIVLGMPFLEREAILSTNKHLLEVCPKAYSDVDSCLWIGSPRNQIRCSIDGRPTVATADTGSDLNLMSLDYAKRNGHYIDERPEVRRRLQYGDCSEAETMGQVYVNNFSLDWRSPTTMSEIGEDDLVSEDKPQHDGIDLPDNAFGQHHAIFHVLPVLSSDIILGCPLLEATDAFSQQGIQLSSSDHAFRRKKKASCLNLIIEKGWKEWFVNPFKRTERVPPPESESSHHDKRFNHRYEVKQMNIAIESLAGAAKQRKKDELTTLENNWKLKHRGCAFCT
ncbi:hypothetical protein PG991_014201 [Apiospora marii]|uniref:Peptidase A2 domain-containing protein n=1 Tax=Apiospora marii TaxID=335849 RepID=A0ABR1RA38_9PEZI